MKFTTLLATTLSALVASAPVHASSSLLPIPSTPAPGSGMMIDNMPPNNNLPGGGIASSSPQAIHDKRALAKEVSDTHDSSTYYDAAAEKEAEELALALDAASGNVAEIEGTGADDNVKVKRRQEIRGKRDTGGCKSYIPAKCEKCQKSWEMYQACLCEKKALDECVQGKRQNYDVCAKKECSA